MKVTFVDKDSAILREEELQSVPRMGDEIWFGDPIEEYRIFRVEWFLDSEEGPCIQIWLVLNDQS